MRTSLWRKPSPAALLILLLSLATPALAQTDTTHTVTIVNKCPQQIWLAEFGSTSEAPPNWALAPACTTATASGLCASGQTCDNGACTCDASTDCAFGAPDGTPTATCDTTSTPGRCVNATDLEIPAGWSGRLWARTGCSGSSDAFVCDTGQCGPPTGGDIDCTTQGATGNLATLFELFAAGPSGTDNFDVSLVSGYNLPVEVTVRLPTDTPGWSPETAYAAGAQITQKVGQNTFNFTNGGSDGTSGTAMPDFPGVTGESVADGPDISWTNTGPRCQASGCIADLLATCPSPLQVTSNDTVVACDAPANACVADSTSCNADLPYYQCQNNEGATDLFGNVLTLQSPNADTFVCFSADDCPGGTACQLDPTFEGSLTFPAGTGVCTPVTQNGGCQDGDDGMPCPLRTFPFVEYQCATLSDVQSNAQVCVPPTTAGFGNLWWNAANWTVQSETSCTDDSGCSDDQKCLAAPFMGGAAQCTSTNGPCACYDPQPCSSGRGANDGCPGPDQCLNEDGVPDGSGDVSCDSETCYCGPQGVYSGACGPTNPDWNAAALAVGSDTTGWPSIFKAACPVAYSYQFDDPSSNWSCLNTADQLVDYNIQFCVGGGKGP